MGWEASNVVPIGNRRVNVYPCMKIGTRENTAGLVRSRSWDNELQLY
jgi:hypothetical protein